MDIKQIVTDYKLFIDTSTLMSPHALEFLMNKLSVQLHQNRQQAIIPNKVVEEINKHLANPEKGKRQLAEQAMDILEYYSQYQLIRILGDKNDPFLDQTILMVFTRFRTQYNLALITQDRGLAFDANKLNQQEAVFSRKQILTLKIDRNGKLVPWDFRKKNAQPKKGPYRFPLATKVRSNLDQTLTVSHIPALHDSVYSKRFGHLRLIKQIGSGGEGDIFETENGLICKIYKEKALTQGRLDKLQRMTSFTVHQAGICWPKDIVLNKQGQFVGYLMDKAKGERMQTSIFAKPVLLKKHPDWTRRHLVQLGLTILEKIKYLHDHHIIIGDINPCNILIQNEREVYFVDTDSYQIADFPCPVGTVNFTAPEIQGKNFKSFLRTFDHEYFAVATLVFMILLPGKPPFAQQGGGTPAENIKNHLFPYPLKDKSTKKAPDGPWRFIWSHLPYRTKEAFYQVFSENQRISTDQWIDILNHYLTLIHQNKASDELFPKGYKIPDNKRTWAYCQEKGCGKHFEIHQDRKNTLEQNKRKILCDECLEKLRLEKLKKQLLEPSSGSEPSSWSEPYISSAPPSPPKQHKPRPKPPRPQPSPRSQPNRQPNSTPPSNPYQNKSILDIFFDWLKSKL
ncbi:protein kinase domain-containing protein [Thermoflavimicrobium dichotomicum]|uniref:Protein kinase domain-containing protein n=1 Tax=Thermoflavimicrobium dichotomicum TaxID=46223 RepID=A0A1I3R8A5_9BACL|nr:hypothetical protein [Thermoflavimicrobium dichotomicum]SFJ42864.1 Protein kinase domain-containing protein [Thermoflavimicrobium dichotomicum]